MTIDEYERWYRTRYRRTSSALTTSFLIAGDFITALLCIGAGFFLVKLCAPHLISFKKFLVFWPYLPAFTALFFLYNLYPGASLAPAEELRRLTNSSLIVHIGIILSRFVYYLQFDSESAAFVISFAVSPIGLMIGRTATRAILSLTGLGGIPAVIYGAGSTGRAIVDRLLVNKNTCYTPVVIVDDNAAAPGTEYRGIPIIHDTSAGPEIVQRLHIRMAIVAMPELNRKALDTLINDSVSAFRYSVVIPDFFRITNIGMTIRDFGGILGFATSNKFNMFWNLWIKRCMDLLLVFIGGILAAPLVALTALLIKLSSPGPVFYSQTRIGKNGRTFRAHKFRSMVVDSEQRLQELLARDSAARAEWERSHKLKNDPRVTAIGTFLRKTSLDELPQLFNILRGEMSFVGPRPIVDAEIQKYGADFRRIFSIRPGLTGLWQVSGRSDTAYHERVSLDTYYLQSWSLWLDFWVLYKTIGVVFKGRGAY